MTVSRRSKADAEAHRQLSRLALALQTYWQIMCGKPEPDILGLLVVDWQSKKATLEEESKRIGFDLVELAKIVESPKYKIGRALGRPQDAMTHTVEYLISRQHGACPPLLHDPWTDRYLEAAKENGDVEFFIRLGQRLKGRKKLPPRDPQVDRLKLFFIMHWAPRFYPHGALSGRPAIWPGLAYMTNAAKQQVFNIGHPGVLPPDARRAFVLTWERLQLLEAKTALFKEAVQREGSIFFA